MSLSGKMGKFNLNKLLLIDPFYVLIFGVTLAASTFSIRDVVLFDRLIRGIIGLVLCCMVIGFLIRGHKRLATISLLSHYVAILISSQVDSNLALVHLNFINNRLVITGYHSPYKNPIQQNFKVGCPRVSSKNLADNVLILEHFSSCQFVVEVGSEDYANYVLYASLTILPLIITIVLAQFIAHKCFTPTPEKKKAYASQEQSLSLEFETPPTMQSNRMISSFTTNEFNMIPNFNEQNYI